MLNRDIVITTLSTRISKDITEALEYIDVHDVMGVLEMIRMSIGVQAMKSLSKLEE